MVISETPKPIEEIAAQLGIAHKHLESYGPYKAKVRLEALQELPPRPTAKYIDVTAITPTPLGEGKTVNAIGLSLGLNRLGKKAAVTIRQPSMGPIFGIKGGGAGGGASQVIPSEEINLHLTGDIHAVSLAHNLLSALLDNHLFHGNTLNVDPATITWRRVVDLNDRALRNVTIGQKGEGVERSSGFDIAVASEIMAILALAKDYRDLRERLGRMIVAQTEEGKPVTANDLKATGALAALVRDTLKPNLLQTSENTPAFIHTGPFGNIAPGNSSILADQLALRTAEYVVTESGFGAELGFEKFINIKCRMSGLFPSAVMIVCTIRGLKAHSGHYKIVSGKPLPEKLLKEDLEALQIGSENMQRMIEIVTMAGLPVVVAVNRFPADTDREITTTLELARKFGAHGAEVIEAFSRGGEGATAVAKAVIAAAEKPSRLQFFYPLEASIKDKIKALAQKCYGAKEVAYSAEAERKIKLYTEWGLAKLPICMAKTQLSLSHDPQLKGAPKDYTFEISDMMASAGAGFLYPIAGKIMLMPGLPSHPASEHIDIDEQGNIVGMG